MTNLLQFCQGLLLHSILFKVILRGVDNFLDDLLEDFALFDASVSAGSWRAFTQHPVQAVAQRSNH